MAIVAEAGIGGSKGRINCGPRAAVSGQVVTAQHKVDRLVIGLVVSVPKTEGSGLNHERVIGDMSP